MESTSYAIWNVSPLLFTLGPLKIRWYGVLFAAGFIVGVYFMQWVFHRENKPAADLDSMLVHILVGTIIGARLGHVVFYDPSYYFSNPLEILKIWEGGLASHGGAVGIFVALLAYQRRHRDLSYLWLMDRLAIPVALGGALIRLGNLFNSEIIGLPTDVPWALIFARVDLLPRHPVQLYEAIVYALIAVALALIYTKRIPDIKPALLSGLLLVSVFTARFFLEYVKVPQAAYDGMLPLTVGQLLSLPMIAVGMALLLRRTKSAKHNDQQSD